MVVTSDIVEKAIPSHCDVLVVGAGPVGMLQALMLDAIGYDVIVIDTRTSVYQHSRAIGIHPPGLASLAQVGLADKFIESGLFVTGGRAFVDGQPIGRLSFDKNVGAWKYPLVVPQYDTEKFLEQELMVRKVPLFLGYGFTGARQSADSVLVSIVDNNSFHYTISCRLLIGCDGKRSEVRRSMGAEFLGGTYKDRYVMGDYSDDGSMGNDGVINLHSDGVVESFPLPGSKRRWVAYYNNADEDPSADLLETIVLSRMPIIKGLRDCSMFSSFGIERWRADKLVSGRIVLAGDAAHVASPIGGQGMNLGWMDASDLTQSLSDGNTLANHEALSAALRKYELKAQKRAKVGIRRAWFNTIMGRPSRSRIFKSAATRLIVNTSLQSMFARRFTMNDL